MCSRMECSLKVEEWHIKLMALDKDEVGANLGQAQPEVGISSGRIRNVSQTCSGWVQDDFARGSRHMNVA